MARIANMLALISACLLGASGPTLALDAKLQYDGVYSAWPETPMWSTPMYPENPSQRNYAKHYLRFYPDGTVLAVTSTGEPAHLKKWFTPENPNVSVGKFTLSGNRIEFSTISRDGTVDYHGSLDGNKLRLRSLSHINQHRGSSVYVFSTWGSTP